MTCADPDLYDMLERPQALLPVCRGVQSGVVFTVQRCTVCTSMQFVKMYSIHYTVPGNFCAMFSVLCFLVCESVCIVQGCQWENVTDFYIVQRCTAYSVQ